MLKSELASKISSNDIPASVEQGVQVLNGLLPDEIVRKLVLCDDQPREGLCREFNINFRLRLERQISNEWIRPPGSTLRAEMDQDGLADPEEIASKLMNIYIQSLEAPIDEPARH